MRTVIVTAIGSFSAPAVIRELKEAGCRVVGTDINPKELIAMSAEADVFENLPRCDAGKTYVDAMAELVRREKAEAVCAACRPVLSCSYLESWASVSSLTLRAIGFIASDTF